MLLGGAFEQQPEEIGALGVGDAPADDPPAEDLDNHIEIEVGPFAESHQLGDVPGPDLIRAFSQQFRLLICGSVELGTAFVDFPVLAKGAVHGSDRAMVEPLVEQSGVDFSGRLVGKVWRMQQIEDGLLLRCGQCSGGFGARPGCV